MRKLIVKLFNLVYLAGAALSIFALCTRPVVSTEVGVSFTSDQVADKLIEIFNQNSGDSSDKSGYRIRYRDDASSEQKITREDIKEAFPNGFSLKVGIKIEAKDAFNINNKELLKNSIAKSIDKSLTEVIGSVTEGLHSLIKTITEKLAKDELAKAINEQINQYFQGASAVTDEEVQAVYDNIYNTINQDGDVTVEDLANAIVGEKDPVTGEYPEGSLLALLEEKKQETGTGLIYGAADPQPTMEEVEADIAKEESERLYYLEVINDDPETPDVVEKSYVRPEHWELGATYYVQKYDTTNVTGDDIADSLAKSLDSIPGLVDYKQPENKPTKADFDATVTSEQYYYSPEAPSPKTFVQGRAYDATKVYYTVVKDVDPQPSEAEITAELGQSAVTRHYVIANSNGYEFPTSYKEGVSYSRIDVAVVAEEIYNTTTLSSKYFLKNGDNFDQAKVFDASAEYYIRIVNDVDTALAKLVESMLGGSSSSGEESKAYIRGEGAESEEKSTQEQLQDALKEYIYKLLPLDSIYSFTETADQYSTYVVLGLIGLMVFPWALFALVTLIRTLRKKKCWTKPWIVFVFAFIQVIFGIVLTYGTKYAMPLLAKYLPQVAEFLESTQLGIDIRTGCLIPSFVYCAFIVMTIPYIIFAHPLKVEWKLEKRARKMERR